jgi:hypothetical protein
LVESFENIGLLRFIVKPTIIEVFPKYPKLNNRKNFTTKYSSTSALCELVTDFYIKLVF